VLVCFVVAVVLIAVLVAAGVGHIAPLVGWDSAAALYLSWVWTSILRLDPAQTAVRARREDPGRWIADGVLLSASVASLAAVGVVLIHAGHTSGQSKHLLIALGILSVIASWSVVHTVFTLRYAGLYYEGQPGGVDFNESEDPRYSDFAYLAFTLGMTFQVSDTDLQTKEMRATALRHALLSYVFGAVIIATTINLVAGLTA
jgi:uncharacterized membrane protein